MLKYTVYSDKRIKAESNFRSWLRLDTIFSCFTKGEKVCLPIGLFFLCALLLLVSCCILSLRRCRVRDRNSGVEAACLMYCFLGNVCSAVGAILSHQLDIQVQLAVFMALLDMVNFIAILLPLCLCWNSIPFKRQRMRRRRRRQTILAVSGLVLLGAGSYLRFMLSPLKQPVTGRRLLSDLLQDKTTALGYSLGLLSLVIGWTSRLPVLSRTQRGERLSKAHVASGLLCSLGGVLYTSAVLLYDRRLDFILGALPWLLTAVSCAALDLLIVALCWCRRGRGQQPRDLSPDIEHLLGGSPSSCHSSPRLGSDRASPPQNKALSKVGDLGHYMDVNILPVRKVCLKQVTLSRDGVSDSQYPRSTVRVVRVDETCTSDSSFSSDLEWDFEVTSTRWNTAPIVSESLDQFPLQEWPTSNTPSRPRNVSLL